MVLWAILLGGWWLVFDCLECVGYKMCLWGVICSYMFADLCVCFVVFVVQLFWFCLMIFGFVYYLGSTLLVGVVCCYLGSCDWYLVVVCYYLGIVGCCLGVCVVVWVFVLFCFILCWVLWFMRYCLDVCCCCCWVVHGFCLGFGLSLWLFLWCLGYYLWFFFGPVICDSLGCYL